MILYQNGLIVLDYNPSTDILAVELPNVVEIGVQELGHALQIIAEHTRNYDISRLLLDSSRVMVGQIEDTAYRAVVGRFIDELTRTRLRMLARVNSELQAHEERVVSVTTEAVQRLGSDMRIRTFNQKSEALSWLLGQE